MNDQNSPPKWKKFEKFVASIQKCLTPHAEVTHNVFIQGKSGVKRQVDIAVRYNLGQFNLLVVIDCKDWKNPVDISDVGSFSDLVEDIGANKGAIVCNSGFTSGAIKRAKEKGIDLLRAAEAESKDWPVYLAIPTLCDFRYIEYYSYGIHHSAPTPFMIPATDPTYLEVYNKDGELIDIITNLIKRAWNDGKFPDEPGEYKDLKFIQEEVYFKVSDNLYGPAEITAKIIVRKKLFFGEVPLEQGKGFQNEVTGGFTTHSLKTTNIDVVEVEKNWRRLKSEDELSIKPALVLVASDVYPLIKTE